MAEQSPRMPTLEEPPREKLEELAQTYPDVLLYLRRFTQKGKIESLKSVMKPIQDLLTDDLRDWLQANWGGGAFIVEPRDPGNHSVMLCTRYALNIPGPPKIAPAEIAGAPASLVGQDIPPSYVQTHTGWRTGTLPGAAPAAPTVNPRDFSTYTSDAVAMQQINELREEIKAQRREAGQQISRLTRELEQARDTIRQRDLEHERRLQAERDAAQQREMANLRSAIERGPAKPAVDVAALVAAFGSIVPIFVSLIQTGKDKQQLALEAQRTAEERHTNLLTTLLKRPEGDPNKPVMDLLTTLLPKLLDSGQKPDKIVDMIAEMGAAQMQTIHMAAQAIQQLTPPDEAPAMQMMRTVIEGVAEFAASRSTPQQILQQQAPPARLPQQQPATQQVAQVVSTVPAAAVSVAPASAPAQAKQDAAAPAAREVRQPQRDVDIATAVVNDPNWPPVMKTNAWLRFVTTLHSSQAPEQIAEELATMLRGFAAIHELVDYFIPIFDEDNPVQPSTLLKPFFAEMPIGGNAPRLEAILVAIDREFTVDDDEDEDEGDEGDDGDEDAATNGQHVAEVPPA